MFVGLSESENNNGCREVECVLMVQCYHNRGNVIVSNSHLGALDLCIFWSVWRRAVVCLIVKLRRNITSETTRVYVSDIDRYISVVLNNNTVLIIKSVINCGILPSIILTDI